MGTRTRTSAPLLTGGCRRSEVYLALAELLSKLPPIYRLYSPPPFMSSLLYILSPVHRRDSTIFRTCGGACRIPRAQRRWPFAWWAGRSSATLRTERTVRGSSKVCMCVFVCVCVCVCVCEWESMHARERGTRRKRVAETEVCGRARRRERAHGARTGAVLCHGRQELRVRRQGCVWESASCGKGRKGCGEIALAARVCASGDRVGKHQRERWDREHGVGKW